MSDAERVAGYASVGAVVQRPSADYGNQGTIGSDFDIVCSGEKQKNKLNLFKLDLAYTHSHLFYVICISQHESFERSLEDTWSSSCYDSYNIS